MTDAEIVKLLGGPTRLSQLLDLPLKRVGNWTTRGIPYRYRHRVGGLLIVAGQAVPADFLDRRPA